MNAKKTPIPCSLLISTYNWPEALEVCLKSVMKQSVLPNEIIIADDGSTKITEQLIVRWREISNIPLLHVWHPDNGFRLSEIRNKAILRANFPYIIQIDGDIILHQKFIEDHLRSATPSVFLCGSRVTLTQEISKKVLIGRLNTPSSFQIPIGFLFNHIRIPVLSHFLAPFFRINKIEKLRGCNMSFWKEDLLTVNGYNEDMMGWGPEDKELAVRLINAGIEKRSLKFLGIAYHLYHREIDRSRAASNRILLKEAFTEKKKWAKNGITKEF